VGVVVMMAVFVAVVMGMVVVGAGAVDNPRPVSTTHVVHAMVMCCDMV
jgi:Na+/H+ antiporter NhaC